MRIAYLHAMGSIARLEPAHVTAFVSAVVALALVTWPAAASGQSTRGPSRDSVVTALRQAGHDFSLGRLRDAEQALAQGRRGAFEGIRQQNFCSMRAAARDLELACRYLEELDAPPPVPAAVGGAARGATSVLSLRRVQELLGRMVVVPGASIANRVANARCDGVGCANVWDRACAAERLRLRSDLRTCDTAGCLRDIELSAQLEFDCASVPQTLRERVPARIPLQPRSDFGSFATTASSMAAARIAVALQEAESCRASARAPLRCLRPTASGVTHDAYVQWLRDMLARNPIAAQFPSITAAVQAELTALAQMERRLAASCNATSASLEVSPQHFFEAHACSETTLSNATWTRVHDHYLSLQQEAQRRVEAERSAEAERRAQEQRRIQAELDRRQREQDRQRELARRAEEARRDAERRAAAERSRREQQRRDRRRDCHRQCDSGCNGNANCTRQCIAQTCR